MRKVSIHVILWATVGLAGYDVLAFVVGKNATFSVIMTDWSFYTPWIPFAWGCLMGHWWFPAKGSKYDHVD